MIRIGYLPFYVGYYEGICPEFPTEKLAVAERCAAALKQFGEVVWLLIPRQDACSPYNQKFYWLKCGEESPLNYKAIFPRQLQKSGAAVHWIYRLPEIELELLGSVQGI